MIDSSDNMFFDVIGWIGMVLVLLTYMLLSTDNMGNSSHSGYSKNEEK